MNIDTIEAKITIQFGTTDAEEANKLLGQIVSKIEWSSNMIEDVYITQPPGEGDT
jgi:hypothetical protein